MTDEEARPLLSRLLAAFPRFLEQETIDLYLGYLRGWELEPATATVETIIRNSRVWPSYAELREVYFKTRDRLAAYERQDGVEEVERVPPPPEILAMIANIGRGMAVVPDETTLPEAGPGRCDDCRREVHVRRRFGSRRLELCQACALSRLRAVDSGGASADARSLDTSGPSAGAPLSVWQTDDLGVETQGSPEPAPEASAPSE